VSVALAQRSVLSGVTDELEELARALGLDPSLLASARAEGVFDGGPAEVAAALVVWMRDPVQYVRDVFRVEPDLWQRDALESYWFNDRTAMVACKGPGKTAVLAWCGWGSLSLYPHANGIALSITEDNLRDNLWKELAWWYARSPWLQRCFKMGGERIEARESPKTWWLSARAFAKDARPDQQANTLAGLHSQTHVFVLCDESSDYPPGVIQAAEGIFTNKGVVGEVGGQQLKLVARLIQAGNPTRSEGPLYEAAVTHRRRWHVIHITGDPDDPKRSPRINIDEARAVIAEHGRETAWVMVNILGQFPPVGSDKLLGPVHVQKAVERVVRREEYRDEAKVLGVDVAAGGLAKTAAWLRQGSYVIGSKEWRLDDTDEIAEQIALLIIKHKPHRVFIDIGGVGRGVYSRLKHLGYEEILVGVDFGSAPSDPRRWADKRTEMHDLLADAVKKWLCIPDHAGLRADLLAPKIGLEIVGKKTVRKLESKKDMAKRGIPSPDDSDALALTFAHPVQPPAKSALTGILFEKARASQDYTPEVG
jgi:hypothetical protein